MKKVIAPANEMPLVSVIIPTFNRAKFISQTLDSVLVQISPPPEVIVVDDGSTDDTRQVLRPYDGRIRYLYQENQGQSVARNVGLQHARGRFIAFLDSDDYWLDNSLSDQLARFETDPALGVVQGGWRLVDHRGGLLTEPEPWREFPDLDLETWALASPLFLGATLFRREWTDRVGPFNPQLEQAEDLDYYLRMAILGCKMVWIPRTVVCYRQHDGNITRNVANQQRFIEQVITAFFRHPELPEAIRCQEGRACYYRYAWFAWRLFNFGEPEAVVPQLKRSLTYSWNSPQETLYDWLRLFGHWQLCNATGEDCVEDLIPLMLEASETKRKDWCRGGKTKWWELLWWLYMGNETVRARLMLAGNDACGFHELIAMAKGSLEATPHEIAVCTVKRLWRDALAIERIPVKQRHAVTELYLTILGKAILSRRTRVSWDALRHACRHTRDLRAIAAWVGFMRSTVHYLVSGKGRGVSEGAS